ncbi:hypothetical protein [Pedobacter caeni]|uniref:Uncharacterized protein n=1 Tax=Pedobacter caeni TaxID=288992 RepID=A0A1M5MVG1_9SPHI|nr:hypothetical protein [Pedobacter caeni]SHG80763.1 hypothetical protein SAMN04488522_107322 [Pedobacter caeni]
MLRSLSYVNILLAIVYLLMFLLNGSTMVILGLLLVVILNILVIKKIQDGWGKTKWIHYGLSLCCLGFAAFLLVGLVHIVRSSIAYHYFSNTLTYIVLTGLFLLCIIVHFLLLCFYPPEA